MKTIAFAAAAALAANGLFAAGDYPVKAADIRDVAVTGGFWLPRVETNRMATVWTDLEKCELARIPNFTNAAARAWGTFKGIPFDDSDVFKVIEGAAYTLATHPDPKLESYMDRLIDEIAKAQEPDGYLYTARTLGFTYKNKDGGTHFGMMGPTRWSNCKSSHELYNAGHMYEAAVAYFRATGKRTLLDVAVKNADLVDRTFGPGATQLKAVPGHEEIELALVKLYRATGEKRYLALAKHFLDARGNASAPPADGDDSKLEGSNLQKHRPVRDQREAVGHAVRAGYLYCAVADVAALTGDKAYRDANDALWDSVVSRKLHLTGGIGARPKGEAFGADFELPNKGAYLETCAAIANALWNERLFLAKGDAKYIDILERIIYNGFLSGVSMSGREFFYPNPQASAGNYKRSEWFGCSCCPVNIVRFIPQIATFAYATCGNEAYVNLFVESDASLALGSGRVRLSQKTQYPWKGASSIAVEPETAGLRFDLKIRVPGWAIGRPVPSGLYAQTTPASESDVRVSVNGKDVPLRLEKGYCRISREWKKGDTVEISMAMPVKRIKADARVEADRGRLAVERGPLVYCAEGVDNGGRALDRTLAADAVFIEGTVTIAGTDVVSLSAPSVDAAGGPCRLTLVPYFAWCHRGAGEMETWFPSGE